MSVIFSGTLTALVTPFRPVGTADKGHELELDLESLDNLVQWQLKCGVDGLVVVGTTGEPSTLSASERVTVIKRVLQQVKGQVPVVVGAGTNDTKRTIELVRQARELGADGVLVVSPYYNKPNQEGLFQHFAAVARDGGLPTLIYDIPSRTGVEIALDTYRRLISVEGIVGVKVSTDSLSKIIELSLLVGDRWSILAADCGTTSTVIALGGRGAISATANVIPEEMLAVTRAGLAGDYQRSMAVQKSCYPKIKAVFAEPNPCPAKAALAMMGVISSDAVRLPLVSVRPETRQLLASVLGINLSS